MFDLVLNRESLSGIADVPTAKRRMEDLFQTIISLIGKGANRVLRTRDDFNTVLLTDGYLVSQWRNDESVDKDLRRYLTSLTTKAPYLVGLDEHSQRAYSIECHVYGERSEAIEAVYLLDGVSVSFNCDAKWQLNYLPVSIQTLSEGGELEEDLIAIRNASSPAHVVNHESWFELKRREALESGNDLRSIQNNFNGIEFLESAFQYIELPGNAVFFPQILRKLLQLEKWVANWGDVVARRNTPFKISGESAPTLEQFSAERTFEYPTGQNTLFEPHFRLTHAPWRVHFYVDATLNKVVIGYIGPHLRTVKNPT